MPSRLISHHLPVISSLKILAVAGGAGGIAGAMNHDLILTWAGAAIGIASAFATAAIAIYHEFREARRLEDAVDRNIQSNHIQSLARVQSELEMRIALAESWAREVTAVIEKVQCRFPEADGSARCSDQQPVRRADSVSQIRPRQRTDPKT